MVHASSKNAQASFSTERIIARENDNGVLPDQRANNQLGKQFPEPIDIPNGLREESVIIREVAIAGRIAGDDQIGDIAMSSRENPAGHQKAEGLKAWMGEDGRK